jgi:hypothetical protein
MYSDCVLNSTDSKPTTVCVEVCTDDALLHGVGLMWSELVLLAVCCGGDYDQVSPVFYWSDSDATTHPLYRLACQAVDWRSHLGLPNTHLASCW